VTLTSATTTGTYVDVTLTNPIVTPLTSPVVTTVSGPNLTLTSKTTTSSPVVTTGLANPNPASSARMLLSGSVCLMAFLFSLPLITAVLHL